MARVGEGGGYNCTLSYTRDGKGRSFKVRATALAHGTMQVATESRAREVRAFYPRQRTSAQFIVTVALLGRKDIDSKDSEYQRFNLWMRDYMRYLLNEDIVAPGRGMTVTIPTRYFNRQAVPLGPLSFGEHVGSMLWLQQITFETTFEPLDTKNIVTSSFDPNGTQKDKNARFFYPGEDRQLSGDQKPAAYDTINTTKPAAEDSLWSSVPHPGVINGAVTGNVNQREHEARRPSTPTGFDRRALQ